MQIAVAIVAILIGGGIVGSVLDFGGIWLGIPFALLAIGAVVGKETMDRQRRVLQMKRFRREVKTRKVDFTETDRRTMV
jgi:hypothetical protein